MNVIYEPKGRAAEYSLLAINHYRWCTHGCEYCYVPAVLHISPEKFHSEAKPRDGVLEALRKEAPKFAGTNKRVLLSFTTDPYQPAELEFHLTRKILEVLREFDIPFQVLTKGGISAIEDFKLYGPKDAFAISLTSIKDGRGFKYEPGASAVFFRLMALRRAFEQGIETWVSLEPVLDAEESLNVISETHEFTNLYKIGMLNHRASELDWRAFGIRAIARCEKLGVKYFIKSDLSQYLSGIAFTNTDNRIIQR
jgi:DNA repair photolyase